MREYYGFIGKEDPFQRFLHNVCSILDIIFLEYPESYYIIRYYISFSLRTLFNNTHRPLISVMSERNIYSFKIHF